MSHNTEELPHDTWYFTREEMKFMEGLVSMRPYREVSDFMEKISKQFVRNDAVRFKSAVAKDRPQPDMTGVYHTRVPEGKAESHE